MSSSTSFNDLIEAGIQFLNGGKPEQALFYFRQATQGYPDRADGWHLHGVALAQSQEYTGAITSLEQAIALGPQTALFYRNLAQVYQDLGNFELALATWQRLLALTPGDWSLYYSLGVLSGATGKIGDAVRFLEIFVEHHPDHAEALANLGVAYGRQKETQRAITHLRRSLDLNPRQPSALNNLANAYLENQEYPQAEACCQEAIALAPDYEEAYYHWGLALQKQDKLSGAIDKFEQVLSLNPHHVDSLNCLGNTLSLVGKYSEAIACYQKSLTLEPERQATFFHLGNMLLTQGKTEDVLRAYQDALALDHKFMVARSNYLFSLNYSDTHSAEFIYQEHQKWSELYERPLLASLPPAENAPDPQRRIRVGYLSGDFKVHSVAFFLAEILSHHDHQAFEIIAFCNNEKQDSLTEILKAYIDGWHDVAALSDSEVVELIRREKIDILIDLSGHSNGSRLLVFAQKPAPIQVTYLGYPNTTGLTQIDYRLTDIDADPPGVSQSFYSEKLWFLPTPFLCYHPPDNAPPILDSKVLKPGKVTLGSFNNFAKISPTLLGYWREILTALPEAELILKTNYEIDDSAHYAPHHPFYVDGL